MIFGGDKFIISTIVLVMVLSIKVSQGEDDQNSSRLANGVSDDILRVSATENGGKVIRPECTIFKDIGVNDLSVNDVVARSSSSNLVCIKARFSLAVKVEALLEHKDTGLDNGHQDGYTNGFNKKQTDKILMGFLPLDSVVKVEDNCYDPSGSPTKPANERKTDGEKQSNLAKEPEMSIEFVCGNLTFTFAKSEDSYFVSSIKGVVNLDPNTERAFEYNKPVFATRDLDHHFKYDPLIEVVSEASTKAYILTANFYKTEMEAFRNTSSREFIRPPEKEVPDEEKSP